MMDPRHCLCTVSFLLSTYSIKVVLLYLLEGCLPGMRLCDCTDFQHTRRSSSRYCLTHACFSQSSHVTHSVRIRTGAVSASQGDISSSLPCPIPSLLLSS